jgi:hypothetical protein
MIFEHIVTRRAARSAYWVIVIVGPAIAIRFIASAAYDGSGRPSRLVVGMIVAGILAVVFYGAVKGGPTSWKFVAAVSNKFQRRPVAPAFWAFIVAAVVGFVSGLRFFLPGDCQSLAVISWIALGLGSVALAVFAFTSASVLGIRVDDGGKHSR